MKSSDDKYLFHRDIARSYPMMEKAEGIYLYGSDGKKYIDGVGGIAVVTIGHGVKDILDAMMKQARKACFIYTGQFVNEPQLKLAKKIVQLTPAGLSRVFFLSGGAEATETALKMARQYHLETGNPSKYRVISRWLSYHGNTIGALSMSGRPQWRKNFIPLLLDFPHIAPPYCYRCPFDKEYPKCGVRCAYELERAIELEGAQSISAFIAEPVVGTTAVGVTPPPEYYPIIREICDKYNILFIVDEVITGLGRTGKNFGIDHWGVTPDIIATGKGLSSGYTPIAAVIAHEKVYEAFLKGSKSFIHGHTYAGNSLSCAIGLAVQEYVEKENLIEKAAQSGRMLIDQLQRLKNIPIVGDVRGKGLLIGVEFVRDKGSKSPFKRNLKVAETVVQKCFEKGLVVVPGVPGNAGGEEGDQIQITPPFIIKREDVDQIVRIVEESVREVQEEL